MNQFDCPGWVVVVWVVLLVVDCVELVVACVVGCTRVSLDDPDELDELDELD